MFYVKENVEQKEKLQKLFKRVELLYGSIPPQIKGTSKNPNCS